MLQFGYVFTLLVICLTYETFFKNEILIRCSVLNWRLNKKKMPRFLGFDGFVCRLIIQPKRTSRLGLLSGKRSKLQSDIQVTLDRGRFQYVTSLCFFFFFFTFLVYVCETACKSTFCQRMRTTIHARCSSFSLARSLEYVC